MNPELNPQDAELAKLLERTAQSIQPSPAFKAELEDKLNNARKPQRDESRSRWGNVFSILGLAASLAVLAFVLNWAIKNFTPIASQPASGSTVTVAAPTPQGELYEFNGIPLYLNAALPDAQQAVPLYSTHTEQFATEESVRALATQFHMNGRLYKTPGFLQDDFLVVDGNHRLQVRSNQYFTYYPDYPRAQRSLVTTAEVSNAEAQIAEFFSANGFTFPYTVEYNPAFGSYYANALTADGKIIVNESVTSNGARFQFDSQGILSVDFSLLSFDSAGTFGIISAEQALQIAMGPSTQRAQANYMPFSKTPQSWYREYPFDKTLTYWGFLSSVPSATGGDALVTLDGYNVTGNISDVPANSQFQFVQASGQFHSQNGAETFNVDSWSAIDGSEEALAGRIELTANGPQLATKDRGNIRLAPLPANFPIPMENACVTGVTNDGLLEWKTIQAFYNGFCGGGGGGGGGGPGFYLLNLSGTSVPLPTPQIFPTPIPLDQLPTGQLFEGLSGTLSVTIHVAPDGTERAEYAFIFDPGQSDIQYVDLAGDTIDALKTFHYRPLKIWGRLDHYDAFGTPVVMLDHYEVPFPDVQSKIIIGKVSAAEVNGEIVALFIADDGTNYAMLGFTGDPSGTGGVKGDGSAEMQAEVLLVPGETYAGYPGARVFSLAPLLDDQGNPFNMGITSSEPNVIPEALPTPKGFHYTIEKVELAYYIADQRYIPLEDASAQPYIQPVWRFWGHASDGSVIVILVQALQDPYLQPDPAFNTAP